MAATEEGGATTPSLSASKMHHWKIAAMRYVQCVLFLLAVSSAAWADDPPPFERMIRVPVTDTHDIVYQSAAEDLRAVILSRLKGNRLVVVSQIVSTAPLTALETFTTTFHGLESGQYTLSAIDDVGNTSTIPFRISDLSVSVRGSSRPPAGRWADILADAVSSAGVDSFSLYSLADPDHVAVIAKRKVREPFRAHGIAFIHLGAGPYAVEAVDKYEFRMNRGFTLRPRIGGGGLELVVGSSVTLPNTPVGRKVAVIPAPNALVVFPEVFQSGETTFAGVLATPPTGYVLLQKPYAYKLSSSAGYSGPVDVEFTFRQRAMRESEKEALRLYQHSDQGFTDVTTSIDTKRNRIRGRLTALGTVMMVYPADAQYRTIQAAPRKADPTALTVRTRSPNRLERKAWDDVGLSRASARIRDCGFTPVSDAFRLLDQAMYVGGHGWSILFDRSVLESRGLPAEADVAVLGFDTVHPKLWMLAYVGTTSLTTSEFRTSGFPEVFSVFATTSAFSRAFQLTFSPDAQQDAEGVYSVPAGAVMRLLPSPDDRGCLQGDAAGPFGVGVALSIDGDDYPPAKLPSASIELPGIGMHSVSLQVEYRGSAWGKPTELKVRVVPLSPRESYQEE